MNQNYLILLAKEDIHFIPVITGAGRGVGKILLGAALIGLFLFPQGLQHLSQGLVQVSKCYCVRWFF